MPSREVGPPGRWRVADAPSAATPEIADAPGAPGPASVTWKLHCEVALLAGWGRAILLQLAHPLIAQGVAEHSAFAREPGSGVQRLHRTLESMLALTFGTAEEAQRAVDRINRIHDRVHGALPARQGDFAAGTVYSAHDPALLAWVHATLVDSFIITYERFVGALTGAERDRYCAEASRIEPQLGIPVGQLPRRHADLLAYVEAMLAGGAISVGDTARAIARDLLSPPLPWAARPLAPLLRLPTVGLLPPGIRDAYGLAWNPRRERALRRLTVATRLGLPLLPRPLRHWAAARAALARQPG